MILTVKEKRLEKIIILDIKYKHNIDLFSFVAPYCRKIQRN